MNDRKQKDWHNTHRADIYGNENGRKSILRCVSDGLSGVGAKHHRTEEVSYKLAASSPSIEGRRRGTSAFGRGQRGVAQNRDGAPERSRAAGAPEFQPAAGAGKANRRQKERADSEDSSRASHKVVKHQLQLSPSPHSIDRDIQRP
jgi:hypothetical protein